MKFLFFLNLDAFLCTDCSTLKRGAPGIETLARRQSNYQANVAQDGAFHTNIQSSSGSVSPAGRVVPPVMKDPSSNQEADNDDLTRFSVTNVNDLIKDLRSAFQQGGLMPIADVPISSQYLQQTSGYALPSPSSNNGFDNYGSQGYYSDPLNSMNLMSSYEEVYKKPIPPKGSYDTFNSIHKQQQSTQQPFTSMQQLMDNKYNRVKYEPNNIDCSYINNDRTTYQSVVDPREAEFQNIVFKLKKLLSRP